MALGQDRECGTDVPLTVMKCPLCNHENIEGADQCARCHADLVDPDDLEERSDIERDLLRRPFGELAAHDYDVVSPELSVRQVVRRLNEHGHHCAIVLAGDEISGIFTERDILYKLADRFEARADAPVSEYMTPHPETLSYDDPVAFGLNRMMVGGYRHIPVKREGKLAGVVSVRDILGYMLHRFGECS